MLLQWKKQSKKVCFHCNTKTYSVFAVEEVIYNIKCKELQINDIGCSNGSIYSFFHVRFPWLKKSVYFSLAQFLLDHWITSIFSSVFLSWKVIFIAKTWISFYFVFSNISIIFDLFKWRTGWFTYLQILFLFFFLDHFI